MTPEQYEEEEEADGAGRALGGLLALVFMIGVVWVSGCGPAVQLAGAHPPEAHQTRREMNSPSSYVRSCTARTSAATTP